MLFPRLKQLILPFFALLALGFPGFLFAADPSPGRQGLALETDDLPKGRAMLSAVELLHPPYSRTPWLTSGPMVIHLMEGALSAHGLGGEIYVQCAEPPRLCYFSPKGQLWFFHNPSNVTARFVLVSIDPANWQTQQEAVGLVTGVTGNRVSIRLGDATNGTFLEPARLIQITLLSIPNVFPGDLVSTYRFNPKSAQAQSLVKLKGRWQ